MGINGIINEYTEVEKAYIEEIVNQDYRHLDICGDMDVFFKIFYNEESGKVKVKYRVRVGPDSYQDPTKIQLDEIKEKFGDSEKYIESKSKEEISHIVESFNSIPRPVLI